MYQARKVSGHVFVSGVSNLPLSMILMFDFRIGPRVCYFLLFITYWFYKTIFQLTINISCEIESYIHTRNFKSLTKITQWNRKFDIIQYGQLQSTGTIGLETDTDSYTDNEHFFIV
jgi:hypothetical protein